MKESVVAREFVSPALRFCILFCCFTLSFRSARMHVIIRTRGSNVCEIFCLSVHGYFCKKAPCTFVCYFSKSLLSMSGLHFCWECLFFRYQDVLWKGLKFFVKVLRRGSFIGYSRGLVSIALGLQLWFSKT